MSNLILPPTIREQVDEIMAPLLEPDKWRAFNLPYAKEPFAIVRMEGIPGTGKTTLANHMARKLRRAPTHISFAGVASASLGDTEKKIVEVFHHATETECPTIIMEECDAVLWSRDLVSDDTMYQLGFVNTLLTEIDKFVSRPIPSLLILTTNYPKLLDAALLRRVTDVIELTAPIGAQAVKMWKSKLPDGMSITFSQVEKLAALGATPDQMEKAILKICRKAMRNNTELFFEDFGI